MLDPLGPAMTFMFEPQVYREAVDLEVLGVPGRETRMGALGR